MVLQRDVGSVPKGSLQTAHREILLSIGFMKENKYFCLLSLEATCRWIGRSELTGNTDTSLVPYVYNR